MASPTLVRRSRLTLATVLALAGIVVSILASVPDWAGFLKQTPSEPTAGPTGGVAHTAEASGSISEPRAREDVISPVDVLGTARLPQTEALWLLVVAPDNRYYTTTSFPAPIDIDSQGEWLVQDVGLGKAPSGGKDDVFQLVLVSTPREGSRLQEAVAERVGGSASFKRRPSDARELHRVPVTLRGFR